MKSHGGLSLYVHKNLASLVHERDLVYIQGLIPDLLERSKRFANEVFEHLCSLSTGPIRADEKEWFDPIPANICKRFPDLVPA
jgi:hypothetical protein